MHSIFNISKQFFLRNYLKKQIIKTNEQFFCEIKSKLNIQNTQTTQENKDKPTEGLNNQVNSLDENLTNQKGDNTSDTYNSNSSCINNKAENLDTPKQQKTRKEEVTFYIMHDKYSVRPDKEYRISHTTLESTDFKTKMKDLNVLYYGKNKIL